MKMLHLQYFKALAENEHLFRTANELYISPSALSASISRLETDLGVRLFDRVGRNIQLNEDGKKFYYHVKRVFDELDLARMELKQSGEHKMPSLNVATSTHVLWEEPFAEYVQRNPGIAFTSRTVPLERLACGEQMMRYDFIITALSDIPSSEYEYEVLIPNDRPILAVYEGHPLANRKEISLSEAKNEAFVALSKGFSSRQYFDVMCELAGFTPNIVAEGDYALRTRLVKDHVGITLTTLMGAKSLLLRGLKFIEVVEPVNYRIQSIFWKKMCDLSPQAKAFKAFLIAYYRNYELTLP
ncbi:LysR family transcriptional regulator [Intestinimonas butyriciproducens]|uniref:LysR family transcriptional regulator n=1 Tax=Intestinimonas butyriciproducens TaxID=1297617 RepID=UPI00321BA273